MTLSTLSTQCLIAGSISLILSAVLVAVESIELLLAAQSTSEYRHTRISEASGKLALCAPIVIVSILKIVGIKKRMIYLLVPWLVVACGATAFTIFVLGVNLVTFIQPEFQFYGMAAIGVEILILYPLFKLIGEIRREKADEKQGNGRYERCNVV